MKIAIVKLSALGDIVHSAIALQFIKKNIPNCEITWFVDNKFKDILNNALFLDNIIALPLKEKYILKTYKIIKKYKNTFDIVIDMQGLIKSAIISRILSNKCIGFDKNSIKESFASYFYHKKLACDYNENIILRNLNLISFALNIKYDKDEIFNKKPIFSTKNEYFEILDTNKKNILIAPFSSDLSKNYNNFKEIIKGLESQNIFVCRSNNEELKKAKLLIKNTKAKILDKIALSQMVNLISKCDLVIGNDSGISHIAWSQNVASVIIFGNRPSQRNTFITPINLVIDTGKKIDAKNIDKNDFCINEIHPYEIIKLAKKVLHEK